MTLIEALAILHRVGKIRTPWLPGSTWTDGVAVAWLCLGEGDRPKLGHLWPNVEGWDARMWDIAHVPGMLDLVLDAPGSVGVLGALAREAWGDPEMCAIPNRSRRFGVGGGRSWGIAGSGIDHPTPEGAGHPNEGEAWAAAIIACAVSEAWAAEVTP